MKHSHTDYSNENNYFAIYFNPCLSCGSSEKESQSLTDLKTKKATLIEKMDRISTELKVLKIAISELDTLQKLMTVTSLKQKSKTLIIISKSKER